MNTEAVPINKYNVAVERNEPNIFWRQKVWDLAIYRSMEIWKKIHRNKIENSIGSLTSKAMVSLNGKIGIANGKSFKKDDGNNWHYVTWKDEKHENHFRPLSDFAIAKCKERARKKLS